MNLFKETKLYSMITGACPVCHQESMYIESNPYKIGSTLKMHERCSHCSTKYKMEPSFFFGAMYVSYPVGIAFACAAFVISYFILKIDILTSFLIICGVMIFLLPIILRLSRNIWINFFKSYKKQKTPS
ncbi:DUF983 domain-containing protein [Cellulophaga sp. HaHaR_3_176]|uniref:DUF983 domain-containing protein n=1 Tax=Cellulophaga sp. HaHaR_3_176 TaxID=1942464 RepID=UPI001C1F86DB|nr:DUF983 domain-containing protein [Cellulophaga sp. HaHaR_3_176]QWX83103.1 DUF983 domain-containing protein [Cellulophaga sp. HaHaR_3_176]